MISNRQLFLAHVAQTSPEPLMLEFERAKGVWMYTRDGERYLDLISGINVSNVGHCHPEVIRAVQDQVKQYANLMVYGETVQTPQVELARRITTLLPDHLDNVYFLNSGAEAIEAAIKLALKYTRRPEIICFDRAYHGSTMGAVCLIGDEKYKQPFRPLMPWIHQLPFNDPEALEQISDRTAAVIMETIQGEAGVRLPSESFAKRLQEQCARHGCLLVLDEIQTGFGRTGKLFAFEHFGLKPDMITLAKGMGGGLPISALVASKGIMQAFMQNPALNHITTFGGNAVCCAAALATLNVITTKNLPEQAEPKEKHFRQALVHPAIKTIRGKGLMMAIEFENATINQAVIKQCLENGLLVDWFLFADNCLRIAPPLVISDEEIDYACKKLIKSIEEAPA